MYVYQVYYDDPLDISVAKRVIKDCIKIDHTRYGDIWVCRHTKIKLKKGETATLWRCGECDNEDVESPTRCQCGGLLYEKEECFIGWKYVFL